MADPQSVSNRGYLASLNPQQKEAVIHTDGPVLVLAGAGTGKTRTITHKIAFLIGEGISASHGILAVTFTNKAAEEMRARVEQLLDGQSPSPLVCTFHSFAVRVLRRHAPLVGFQSDFSICDVDDQRKVLTQVCRDLGYQTDELPARMLQSLISRAKNSRFGPEAHLAGGSGPFSERVLNVFQSYQALLKKSNAMDFDDLIGFTVGLFQENGGVAEEYSHRFGHLLIDEYQDTNAPQYELIRSLTCSHRNLTAVGDEDQSIYGFRGADIENILRFEADFPGAKVIKLEENYRSTGRILEAATAVVSTNVRRKGKVLWTEGEPGDLITVYIAENAGEEAQFIARQIWEALSRGIHPLAVLYRTNFQSRQVEEALRRLDIEYRLVGGVSFYNRKEVKDAIAYLRTALNPNDDVALTRIINEPNRGIGRVTFDALFQAASKEGIPLWAAIDRFLQEQVLAARSRASLDRFRNLILRCRKHLELPLHLAMEKILGSSGYLKALQDQDSVEAHDRLLNLKELVTVAEEHASQGRSLLEFLDHAALRTDLDDFDQNARVTLMTLHNAKGLEFPVVFLAGCEEGLFPHGRSVAEGDVEEERRLCYVGMTRAQKKLYLTYSRSRRLFGRDSGGINKPSRFLHEVPESLTEVRTRYGGNVQRLSTVGGCSYPNRGSGSYLGKTYDSAESVRRFLAGREDAGLPASTEIAAGAIVVHDEFGKGRVLKVEQGSKGLKVTVQFPGIGIKKLMQSFARLRPV